MKVVKEFKYLDCLNPKKMYLPDLGIWITNVRTDIEVGDRVYFKDSNDMAIIIGRNCTSLSCCAWVRYDNDPVPLEQSSYNHGLKLKNLCFGNGFKILIND